jgi:hypothetical protein
MVVMVLITMTVTIIWMCIVQTASSRLYTVAAQVKYLLRICGICGAKYSTGSDVFFFRLLWFPLTILIPLTARY